MADNEVIIWSEGMFLRPHHYQQYTRYLENFVEARSSVLQPFPWGFNELQLDEQMLSLGKVCISKASGVFPDGTLFSIPGDDEPPLAIEISETIKDEVVYLCIPLRRTGTVNVEYKGELDSLARYAPAELELFDDSTLGGKTATIQVGKLRCRLMLDRQHRDEYACLGMVRVVELRSDKSLKIDGNFIAPVLNCQASPRIASFMSELLGLLKHRSEALVGRVAATGRGGAADIADFLMLQLINRYLPLVAHACDSRSMHPESFYQFAISLAGELSTFTSTKKQAPLFSPYRHDQLAETFKLVFSSLRHSLSMVMEQSAIPMSMQKRSYGIRVAPISDSSLVENATFVLAIYADMPTEDVMRRFPAVVKVGPVEMIRDLVNAQLPGIKIRPIPVAPKQIPFHTGFVYFELERGGELWKKLKSSGGFAFHIGGGFPGMKIEFWAIRG